VTPLGRIVAGGAALLSLATIAFPTAILGAGFVREMQQQDFLARASMVACVPLFRHLPPAQLAEITALLHQRNLPPRYTVIRRGEHPEAMYFIDQGRVVMRLGERRVVLGPGSFFGELALLEGRPREATVITLTACRLLELDAGDFHRLIGGDPELRRNLLAEARERARAIGHPPPGEAETDAAS
jgi:voltage-gated potassium channel